MNVRLRLLNSPFIWLLALLIAAEVLATVRDPFADDLPAAETLRAAQSRRGWPEYLSGETPTGKKLVVIISNSQGYSREFPAEQTYFAEIRRRFAKDRPDLVIENWSCPGLRTADMELLGLRAAERRAHLVVFMANYGAIDFPHELNLDFPDSDINLLAGAPHRWPALPEMGFWANTEWSDIYPRTLALSSDLVRTRSNLHDDWDFRAPDAWGTFLYPRYGSMYQLSRMQKNRPESELLRKLSRAKLDVFRPFFRQVHARITDAGGDVLWIWQPGLVLRNEPADREFTMVRREASRIIREQGGNSLDLTGAIPREMFLNAGHFTLVGHQRLAEVLFPIMKNEL